MNPLTRWHWAAALSFLGGILATDAAAPIITKHPQSVAVTENATAILKVEASGDAPLSYQWRFNGVRMIGATKSELILSNISIEDEGKYSVDVSNSFGLATSDPAELVLLPQLRIHNAVELKFFARAGKQYALKVSTNALTWRTVESPINGENRDIQRFAATDSSQTLYYRLDAIINTNTGSTGNAHASVEGRRLQLINNNGGRELITFIGASSGTFVSDAEPDLGGIFTWQKTGTATARLVLTYQTPPAAANDRYDLTLRFTSENSGTFTGTQLIFGNIDAGGGQFTLL